MKVVRLAKSRGWHTIFLPRLPPEVLDTIDKALSYESPDSAFQAPMINEKTGELELWDGVTHLLRETHGAHYFPAGLLPTVKKILAAYGHDIQYTETERAPRMVMELGWHVEPLYDYQKEIVKRVMREFEEGNGCIVPLATGGGKSRVALRVVKTLGVKTLILVDTEELRNQWFKVVKETLRVTPARYDGSHKETGNITIAMIQTATRHLKQLIDERFDMVIADECHKAPSKTYYKVLMRIGAAYRLGLSATPDRPSDNAMMKFVGVLGDVMGNIPTARDLMESGHLAKAELEFIRVPAVPYGWKTWPKAYEWGIVGNKKRNELIAKRVEELVAEGEQVLITVERINHGRILENLITGSEFIEAKSPRREKALAEFKEGKVNCLITTLMKEGADIPSCSVLILAGGGKSEVAVIQKAGRALRVTKNKKTARVIDFEDQGRWLRDHSQMRREVLERVLG